jgi:predicted transcriptional regulator
MANTDSDVQNVTVSIRLTAKLRAKVRAVASERGVTQSAVIAQALEEHFENGAKIDSLEERLRAVEEYVERNRNPKSRK